MGSAPLRTPRAPLQAPLLTGLILPDGTAGHTKAQGNEPARGPAPATDRRTAAVVLQMASDLDAPALRRHTVAQLRRIVEEAAGEYPELEIILTGPYVTMFEMFEYVRQDLAKFSIFVVLLMLVVLYLLIGAWRPAAVCSSAGLCTRTTAPDAGAPVRGGASNLRWLTS